MTPDAITPSGIDGYRPARRCDATKNAGRGETGDVDVYLRCNLPIGHAGQHRAPVRSYEWWSDAPAE